MLRDITDEQRIADMLARNRQMESLGTLASGIAHDFNNTLMPIMGFSELMIKRPSLLDDREEALSMLKDINSAAKDAAEIPPPWLN